MLTYVFAATYDSRGNFAIAIPEYDRELITSDATLSSEQIKALPEQNERVIAFRNAYPNEILPKGEVERNTAWNSYQSLQSGHLLTPPPAEPVTAPIDNPASSTPADTPTDTSSAPAPDLPTPSPAPSPAATEVPAAS